MHVQPNLPYLEHKIENNLILQRAYDGYINATAICAACHKNLEDYLARQPTKDFLKELHSITKIPESALMQSVEDRDPKRRGIWVHPQIAINLGMWDSPQFAVKISEWVMDWAKGNIRSKPTMPFHIRRYLINRGKIPPTHFSMLDQMTLNLLAPLEDQDYTLPTHLMPDIAMGRMFCKFLREHGYDPDSFPTYDHAFNDGKRRNVQARLYPNELITLFNLELNKWIRNSAWIYFEERDKSALIALEKVTLKLPAPK